MLHSLRRLTLQRVNPTYSNLKHQNLQLLQFQLKKFSKETPVDEAQAVEQEAMAAEAPKVEAENVKGGHASKKERATRQFIHQQVSDEQFQDKTRQERVYDAIIAKKRGRVEEIEKQSVETLMEYDLKNRIKNIESASSFEQFASTRQKLSKKINTYDIVNSEIYQQFEKKLQEKFDSLKQTDLQYLRTQLDDETGKIPYTIAQKLDIIIDRANDKKNQKIFDLFIQQSSQTQKIQIPFHQSGSNDNLREQKLNAFQLVNSKADIREKLEEKQGIITQYEIQENGHINFENEAFLEKAVQDMAAKNFFFESQVTLYKNIETSKKFNFTSAAFTDKERDILLELRDGKHHEKEILKKYVESKTRIELPELVDYLRFKYAGEKSALNPQFKIAIVDILLNRLANLPESLISTSSLGAFWRIMAQDFPEHPLSQLNKAKSKILKDEGKVRLLDSIVESLEKEQKAVTKSKLEEAISIGIQNEIKKRSLAITHKQLRGKVESLKRSKQTFERAFQKFSPQEAAAPTPQYDFIGEISSANQYKPKRYHNYNPETSSLTEHNLEIEFLMDSFASGTAKKEKTFSQVEDILENMERKGLQKNLETYIVLFPYSLKKEDIALANQCLRESKNQADYQVFEPKDIEAFFEISLKNDNFIGLNLLLEYSHNQQIDFKSFDMNAFRPSLDYYLNTEFNLSHICTFLRYYMRIMGSHIRVIGKPLSANKANDRIQKSQRIFANSEMIDLSSLFSFLVNKTGKKNLVDQSSGMEVLYQGLINFHINNSLHLLRGSTNNSGHLIADKDIALYFRNHFEQPKIFSKIVRVLKEYDQDSVANYELHNLIFQNLDEYMALAKQLPSESFARETLQEEYRLILEESEKKKISEKTAELFLNVFRAQGMHEETVDLCENWLNLTGKDGARSEIRKFYLSHALMHLDFQGEKTPYSQMISETVYTEENQEFVPKTFAITKALFKEKNESEAIKFFKSSLQQHKDQVEKREQALLEEFNKEFSAFSDQNKVLSFDEFSKKYSKVLGKLKQQADSGNFLRHLRDMTAGKSYHQLETLSSYYLLLNTELEFLRKNAMENDFNPSFVSLEKAQEFLRTKVAQEEYEAIKARRIQLEMKLDNAQQQKALELVQLYNSEAVLNSSRMSPMEMQRAITLSSGVSKEKLDLVEEYRSQIEKARMNEDQEYNETDKFFATYKKHLAELLDKKEEEVMKTWQLPQYMQDKIAPKKPEHLLKEGEVQPDAAKILLENMKIFKENNFDINQVPEEFQGALRMYWEWAFEGEIENTDPQVRRENEHNKTVVYFQDQLIDALRKRQADVSVEFAKILNSLKDQEFKTRDYSLVEKLNGNSKVTKQEIGPIIDQLDELVNHPRSPFKSVLATVPFAEPHKLPENFVEENFHKDNPELDVERLVQEGQTLRKLNDDLHQKLHFVENLQKELDEEVRKIESFKQKKRPQEIERSDPALKQQLEAKYAEYQKIMQNKDADLFSREAKLKLMQEVLLLFGQDEKGQIEIPAFYYQDLLQFGIKNNLPAAVRLAEDLISQSGIRLPFNLTRALREYKLEFQDQYRDAFDSTGPVDGASLYRNFKLNKVEETGPVSFYTLDDPALTLHYLKNRKRENHHKLPSLFAWDHKRHGLLGEVIDFNVVERLQKEASRFFI